MPRRLRSGRLGHLVGEVSLGASVWRTLASIGFMPSAPRTWALVEASIISPGFDRDGVTRWPIVRGSGFKGVWADHYTRKENDAGSKKNDVLRAAFGVAGEDNNSNSGSRSRRGLASLVCLPVRSFRGTFAWCTSPLCLQMLRRSLDLAGVGHLPQAPPEMADDSALHANGTLLTEGTEVFLEELDLTAQASSEANEWAEKIAMWVFPGNSAWQEQFKQRFAIISGDAFDFLCETWHGGAHSRQNRGRH